MIERNKSTELKGSLQSELKPCKNQLEGYIDRFIT
jgi:hypothetical protein